MTCKQVFAKKVRRFTCLFIGLVLFQSAGWTLSRAEENPPHVMEPVVVTASRLPSVLSKTPANTTIITREEIEARQPRTTMDLLRQVAGVHVDQRGGRGGVSSVYLRGGDPNFVLVLMDGIKMNDPTNSRGGSFDFSSIDPMSIERIEIVRGPLASVYGSDAMGGVIHIITLGSGSTAGTDRPEASVTIRGGSRDDFYAGIRTGPVEGRRVGGVLQFSVEDDGTVVPDSTFSAKNFNGKLRFSPAKTHWLNIGLRYGESRAEGFPDDSGGPEFAVLREKDIRDISEWTSSLTLGQDLSERWSHEGKISFYRRNEDIVSPGVAPGLRDPVGLPKNRSDNAFKRVEVLWHTAYVPKNEWQLGLGFHLQSEKGESASVLDFGGGPFPTRFKAERDLAAGFFEAELNMDSGLTLEGGIRVDAPEDFSSQLSPRLGLLYHKESTNTVFTANWGKGFKLPSFFSLSHPLVGNGSLKPETSRSIEAGVAQYFFSSRLQLRGTYFQDRFFNLIDFEEGPPPKMVNRSKVKIEGFEIGFDFLLNAAFSIDGHVSYAQSEIVGSNEKLRNRPKWQSGLKMHFKPTQNFSTMLDVLYVGTVHDSSIPTGDRKLDAYVRADLTAVWDVVSKWQVSGGLDNLFNADYKEALGFPAPGVRIYLGLRYLI